MHLHTNTCKRKVHHNIFLFKAPVTYFSFTAAKISTAKSIMKNANFYELFGKAQQALSKKPIKLYVETNRDAWKDFIV